MNILFIEHNFYPTMGGVERVTYTLGEALREKGHQVYYAFYGKDDENLAVGYKMIFNQSLSDEELYSQFNGFLSKNHIALLICQNIHIPRYQKIYKRLKENHSVKIITCYHANPDIWVNKNKWGYTFGYIYIKELIRTVYFKVFGNPYRINQSGMYEITDRYILLSDSFKPIFCKLNKVDGNKLLAIPNPCPFSEDKENGAYKKENIVLVVARMAEQQKRILETLKIWNLVYSNHLDWKLIIVGDGPDLSQYKTIANKLNVSNVQFVGSISTPQDYYRMAKIFMMTSIWEGLPMTLIEAQHFGCVPIVYDSFASVHDIINNGKDGFIIPLHDRENYKNQLEKMMSSPKELYRMSQLCMSNTSFGISDILHKWNNIINSL